MAKKQTDPCIVDLNAPCDEFGNTQPRIIQNWVVYDEEGDRVFATESYWDAVEVLQAHERALYYGD
jgi:hypothetical protein